MRARTPLEVRKHQHLPLNSWHFGEKHRSQYKSSELFYKLKIIEYAENNLQVRLHISERQTVVGRDGAQVFSITGGTFRCVFSRVLYIQLLK